MSYRFRVPLDPAAGLWLLVVCGLVAVGMIVASVLQGDGAQVVIDFGPTETPVASATPEAAMPPETGRVGALVAPVVGETYPPVESVIEHYFGPLGATGDALRVWRCETGPDAVSWVGDAGELGPFQLLPWGAGARFVAAGWNLLDARENVMAAALVVATDGWGAWAACY